MSVKLSVQLVLLVPQCLYRRTKDLHPLGINYDRQWISLIFMDILHMRFYPLYHILNQWVNDLFLDACPL